MMVVADAVQTKDFGALWGLAQETHDGANELLNAPGSQDHPLLRLGPSSQLFDKLTIFSRNPESIGWFPHRESRMTRQGCIVKLFQTHDTSVPTHKFLYIRAAMPPAPRRCSSFAYRPGMRAPRALRAARLAALGV